MEQDSHISALPQEVHDTLCRHMTSTRDIKSLRITCKQMYDKCEVVFAERTFQEMEVNLSKESLTYLGEVSRSTRFAGQVKKVVFEPRRIWGEEKPATVMATDSKAVDILTRALPQFKNLITIDIARYDDPTRFDNNRVNRNDPFGTPTEVFEPNGYATATSLSQAFHTVVYAIKKSSTATLRTLRAGALPSGPGYRSSIDHFAINVPAPLVIRSHKGLAAIEHLHLVLEVCAQTTGLHCDLHLSTFLRQTPHLKSLRLEFWQFRAAWLSDTLLYRTFPHLESLHIEAVRDVRVAELKTFVHRHATTLKNITLVNITFLDDDLLSKFPTLFHDPEPVFQLTSIRIQQICAQREGLLCFDKMGVKKVCEPCKDDLFAVWCFEKGPKCHHGGIVAKGERECIAALQHGLKECSEENWEEEEAGGMAILPWNMLGALVF